MRPFIFARAFVFAFMLTGCSALGLDDFQRCDELGETPREQEAACAGGLNGEFGFPASCRPFRCVDGECVLERDVELCDGSDNDCDGSVDESVFAPSGFGAVQYGETPSGLSVAASGGEARAFWTETPSDEAANVAIAPSVGATRTPLTYERNADVDMDGIDDGNQTNMMFEEGCWFQLIDDATPPSIRTDACNTVAVSAARAGAHTFGAALSTNGCAQGRLRFAEVADDSLRVRGPLGVSNSFIGVGLTDGGNCSAPDAAACQAARDAVVTVGSGFCSETTTCEAGLQCVCGACVSPEQAEVLRLCGFTNIATAAITPPRDADPRVQLHALVAGVGGSVEARCVLDAPRSVAIWGGFIRERSAGGLTNVLATNEGAPLVLGETRGFGAPGVSAAGDAFVVAYPDTDGSANVSIVGPLSEPPPIDLSAACEGGPTLECGATDPQRPRCAETECGSDIGVCVSGTGRCNNGISFCFGVRDPDVVEQCGNELDDDCDGRTDESDCGDCTAVAETCNAVDDDCDGMVDEDVTDTLAGAALGDACGSDVGVCEMGTVTCTGGKLHCAGGVIARTNSLGNPIDICGNSLDDDCDGTEDEPGAGCDTCVPNEPDRERTCDGRDNDCDGLIDETRILGPACSLEMQCPDGSGLSCFEGMCAQITRPPSSGDDPEEVIQPASFRTAPDVRECVATEPIPMPSTTSVAFTAGGLDNFVLAAGAATNDSLPIAMAWTEQDGAHVAVRILTFDATCLCRDGTACSDSCERVATPTALRDPGTVTRVSAGAGDYGPPTIAYAPTGFAAEGDTGGWFVIWTDRAASRILATRVAADGSVLDTPFPAGRTMMGEDRPAAYSIDTGVGYAYVDRVAGEVVAARMSCPAPLLED